MLISQHQKGWLKTQARICKKIFFNFQIYRNLENSTHWGLETAVSPIFAKPVLDIFAVCLLVPRTNLSHTQQSYLCLKNQNKLLEIRHLRFFLSYGLRTTIKITIFSTFYVKINFQAVIVKIHAKNTDSFKVASMVNIKFFFID